MAGNHFVASIDIGTEKIALLVAEKDDDDHLRIIGHNVCPSKGVRRGSIFSIDSSGSLFSIGAISVSLFSEVVFSNSLCIITLLSVSEMLLLVTTSELISLGTSIATIVFTSTVSITSSIETLQNKDIFFL